MYFTGAGIGFVVIAQEDADAIGYRPEAPIFWFGHRPCRERSRKESAHPFCKAGRL
jgi:hypothetical protein